MNATRELWADCVGHPGYQVSTLGRIRSCKKHGWRGGEGADWHSVKGYVGKNGYRVIVVTGRTKHYVHRLVAEAFLGAPPPGKTQVAHWDGDRLNNAPSNLRWADGYENMADRNRHGTDNRGMHSASRKLTQDQVDEIRRRYMAGGESQRSMAAEFGVSQQRISSIIRYESWQYRV